MTRVKAEVPLRCMPGTRIAVGTVSDELPGGLLGMELACDLSRELGQDYILITLQNSRFQQIT